MAIAKLLLAGFLAVSQKLGGEAIRVQQGWRSREWAEEKQNNHGWVAMVDSKGDRYLAEPLSSALANQPGGINKYGNFYLHYEDGHVVRKQGTNSAWGCKACLKKLDIEMQAKHEGGLTFYRERSHGFQWFTNEDAYGNFHDYAEHMQNVHGWMLVNLIVGNYLVEPLKFSKSAHGNFRVHLEYPSLELGAECRGQVAEDRWGCKKCIKSRIQYAEKHQGGIVCYKSPQWFGSADQLIAHGHEHQESQEQDQDSSEEEVIIVQDQNHNQNQPPKGPQDQNKDIKDRDESAQEDLQDSDQGQSQDGDQEDLQDSDEGKDQTNVREKTPNYFTDYWFVWAILVVLVIVGAIVAVVQMGRGETHEGL